MDAISVNKNEISGSEWLKFGFFSILLKALIKMIIYHGRRPFLFLLLIFAAIHPEGFPNGVS